MACHILFNIKNVLAIGFVKCVDLDGVSFSNKVNEIVKEYVIVQRLIAICTEKDKIFNSN